MYSVHTEQFLVHQYKKNKEMFEADRDYFWFSGTGVVIHGFLKITRRKKKMKKMKKIISLSLFTGILSLLTIANSYGYDRSYHHKRHNYSYHRQYYRPHYYRPYNSRPYYYRPDYYRPYYYKPHHQPRYYRPYYYRPYYYRPYCD